MLPPPAATFTAGLARTLTHHDTTLPPAAYPPWPTFTCSVAGAALLLIASLLAQPATTAHHQPA